MAVLELGQVLKIFSLWRIVDAVGENLSTHGAKTLRSLLLEPFEYTVHMEVMGTSFSQHNGAFFTWIRACRTAAVKRYTADTASFIDIASAFRRKLPMPGSNPVPIYYVDFHILAGETGNTSIKKS